MNLALPVSASCLLVCWNRHHTRPFNDGLIKTLNLFCVSILGRFIDNNFGKCPLCPMKCFVWLNCIYVKVL